MSQAPQVAGLVSPPVSATNSNNSNMQPIVTQASHLNSHLTSQTGVVPGNLPTPSPLAAGLQTNASVAPGQLGTNQLYPGLPSFSNVDMTAFQGVDWGSIYGMGMYA